jgi:hypothetical protein
VTRKEAEQAARRAASEERGRDWGDTPVWSATLADGSTIDVHADGEAEARKAVADALAADASPG